MKTKANKIEQVKEGVSNLKNSRIVVLTDFTGLSVNEINKLRKTLRATQSVYQVVKKRLLKFIFKELEMDFEPKNFAGQTGVVFSSQDIAETAQAIFKFAKSQKDLLKILGGFDVAEKKFIEGVVIKKIGQLPSREILLGQLVGTIAGPIRSFLYILSEKGKRS